MAKLIKNIYAQALFDTGLADGAIDSLYEESQAILKAIDLSPEFLAFLGNPGINSDEKLSTVRRIFEQFAGQDMVGFVLTIVEKGRYKELPGILECFIGLVKEYKHIGIVYVTTPMELSESYKKLTYDRIIQTTDYETLEMHYAIDKSLLGGMIIRIGDRVVDSSIKTKLADIHRELEGVVLE